MDLKKDVLISLKGIWRLPEQPYIMLIFDFRDFAYFTKDLVQFHCCFVVFNLKWVIFRSCIHKVKMMFTKTGLSFYVICVMITQCNNTWQALVSRVTSFSIDSMLGEVIGLSAERGDFLAIDVSVEPFWAKRGCLCMTAYKKTRPIRYIREI